MAIGLIRVTPGQIPSPREILQAIRAGVVWVWERDYHLWQLSNPRRACAARVTVLGLCVCVSVCVCLCVSTYSLPTGTKPAHQRYQQL